MDPHYRETLSVAEQAAEWLRVVESGGPDDRAAFWGWMSTSPLHVREMLLAERLDQALRSFDSARRIDVEALIAAASTNVSSIGERVEVPKAEPKRRSGGAWLRSAAACGAILVLACIAYLAVDARDTYVTKLGQQLVFELEDGSVVALNTQSRLKVRFSAHARDIYLPKGQALFEVKHDSTRPFRVHAAAAVIQAVGTQFDVRVLADRTMVSVVEGTVQISTKDETSDVGAPVAPAPAKLSVGEAASIDAVGQIERSAHVDAASITAWRQQRLVFNDATLSWIVDEFNRYNATPRLRVDGDTLRSRRFNGVFSARNPESLLEYLAQDESIAFERKNGEVVIRAVADSVAEISPQ